MNSQSLLLLLLIALIFICIALTMLMWLKVSKISKIIKTLKLSTAPTPEPVKRLRKRYIVFAVLSEKKYSKKEVERSVRDLMRDFFGEELLVKADPQLIYFDPALQRGVIRVAHIYKDHVIAAFALIQEIDGAKCLVIPIKTTGTIKKAKRILYSLRQE